MPTTWQGHYLDGRSATRQPATIQPMRGALHFTTGDGQAHIWPYSQIRQTQGTYEGEQVRLEYGGEISEALVVSDPQFLTAVRRIAPELTSHVRDPSLRNRRIKLTVAAALGAIAAGTLLYIWGIPALAGAMTPLVPISWEQRLGEMVVERLVPEDKQCRDPERMAVIEGLVTKLADAAPENPYHIAVYVVDRPIMNAFAAPGGYVVLFRGLLEKTERPEQLAGVLAHELQHIYKRHTTRAIIEYTSTSFLLAAMAGDFSGAMVYGAEAARTLGMLRYGRAHEKEADTEGMQLMVRAGLDPNGMVEFFQILKKKSPEIPGALEYLSSHPNTQERINYLKQLAAQADLQPAKLMADTDWGDIRSVCQSQGTRANKN